MRHKESGYAFLIAVLLAALVLVALSMAVPRLLTQGQREKEDELIFRGEQYQRAIGRFYKKFGRYPSSVEELLRTNDRSFLRREFADPMSRDGQWRFIRVGPSGEFIGSVNRRLPTAAPAGQPAGGAEADQEDQQDQADQEDANQEEPDEENGDETPAVEETPPALAGKSLASSGTLPLAGVASRSRTRAIKVYQGHGRYFQWEFIYDPSQDAVVTAPGVPAPPKGPAPTPPTPR